MMAGRWFLTTTIIAFARPMDQLLATTLIVLRSITITIC
jgi:hypothetical protein